MPNPNVQQGTLNRLKVSVVLASAPELNITPSYLGKEMLSTSFDGDATTSIPTATGAVQSPEPYQKVTITVHLLKTQNLASAYKARMEANSLLGDITVWPDVQTGQGLTNYPFTNCAIQGVREVKFDGMDPGWVLTLSGYYLINNNLWD